MAPAPRAGPPAAGASRRQARCGTSRDGSRHARGSRRSSRRCGGRGRGILPESWRRDHSARFALGARFARGSGGAVGARLARAGVGVVGFAFLGVFGFYGVEASRLKLRAARKGKALYADYSRRSRSRKGVRAEKPRSTLPVVGVGHGRLRQSRRYGQERFSRDNTQVGARELGAGEAVVQLDRARVAGLKDVLDALVPPVDDAALLVEVGRVVERVAKGDARVPVADGDRPVQRAPRARPELRLDDLEIDRRVVRPI